MRKKMNEFKEMKEGMHKKINEFKEVTKKYLNKIRKTMQDMKEEFKPKS
jgi:flagellar biosynthesis/type III secretory pathway protein FliH